MGKAPQLPAESGQDKVKTKEAEVNCREFVCERDRRSKAQHDAGLLFAL